MKMKTRILIIIALILAVFIKSVSGFAQGKTDYIDTNIHLNIQPMWEGAPPVTYDMAAAQLLDEMDRCGVEKALVLPPPQIAQQPAICDYKDLAAVSRKYRGRIYFLGGGDNLNRLIHKYKPREVTQDVRMNFRKLAEEIAQSGAKGFGEMAAMHLSFGPRHVYEEVSPDHPLFLLLADIAASHNMPINLHMEAVPEDMDLPAGFDMISPNNPPVLHANIPQFERLLDHNMKARIVWQHAGRDNTGFLNVELLRHLLTTHPNLYISMIVEERKYDIAGQPLPNRTVDENGGIRPEWLRLIGDFPDRFMLDSDGFYGSPIYGPGGRPIPGNMKETWSIIGKLPPELANKIGHDNAARIYNLE